VIAGRSPTRWLLAVALAVSLVGCTAIASPSPGATGSPAIVSGPITGEVRPGSPPPSASPSATATARPTSTADDLQPPPAADGFTAQLLACSSISGSTCNGEIGAIPPSGSFVALVLLTATQPGDVVEVVMTGPSGTFPGGPATVAGGNGYYYVQYGVTGLAPGTYEITVLRNGQPAATLALSKG
jgi:hypothetical protein